MNHFFIKLTAAQARNKAHQELQLFVQDYNRALMDEATLKQFKVALIRKTDEINRKYPRCKPVGVAFSSISTGDKEYQSVTIDTNLVLSFQKIDHYRLSGPVLND